MARTFVTVTLPYTTGLPEDVSVNTFMLAGAGQPNATDRALIAADFVQFYNGAGSAATTIAEHLGEGLSRVTDAVQVAFYDADTLPMGSPIGVEEFTLGATDASTGPFDLPSEVAVALSYHADLTGFVEESGVTRPRARRRGRIFLGPLKNGVSATVGGHIRVAATVRTLIAEMASELHDNLVTTGYPWQVWSRVGDSVAPVIAGHVDDAFDVQRRRGVAPTVRTLW